MKNLTKIAVGILIAAVVVFAAARLTGYTVTNKNYDEFAKCLTAKGVKMYGATWCGHCQNQKKMFGESWKYINYVECSNPDGSQTEECKLAGIEGYPTWEFGDGTRVSGELTFEELALKSSCTLTNKYSERRK